MEPTSAASRDRGRIPGVTERAVPPFDDLLRACTVSAVHLEMRDVYTLSDPWFQAWLTGNRGEFERRLVRPWLDLIREVTRRGVLVRRARMISEPVTEYIGFEHATTESNLAAGEQVRWLPRRESSDLLLPGNDYWVFDNQRVQFNYFSGIGDFLASELSDEPVVVKQCAAAFEAVWERAVPHGEYQLR
jgi:hypothetical protein